MNRRIGPGWKGLLRRTSCALCLLACFSSADAQVTLPEDRGAAGLWQALRRLQTTGSAMHIVAHPDDEDAGTITYLARGQGVRTTLLALTRGGGGANLIAPFFFDQLAILRTLEYLEACRHYGVELFFTRAADYGYSKVLAEALSKWEGAEELLRDVVRVIRRERPDVIISRFRGDPRDGHGHHTLAGVLAQRAFAAAADPRLFPEQIEAGLRPWQAKKLYRNNIRPDRRPDDANIWTLVVDSGTYDPLLGQSYYQVARRGYGFHRSQGMVSQHGPAGEQKTYYELLECSREDYRPAREESFFDGIDTSLEGMASLLGSDPPARVVETLGAVRAAVDAAVDAFDPRLPDRVVPPLVRGLKSLRALLRELEQRGGDGPNEEQLTFLLHRKSEQFETALALALALDLEVAAGRGPPSSRSPYARSSTFRHVVPGEDVFVDLRLVNRSHVPVRLLDATVEAPEGWGVSRVQGGDGSLGYNEALAVRWSVHVAEDAPPTRPYWHRDSIQSTLYTVDEPEHRGRPFAPPPLYGLVWVEVDGVELTLRAPVRCVLRDVHAGNSFVPLTVAPPVSVRFASRRGIIPLDRARCVLSVTARSDVKGPERGSVALELPPGWTSEPERFEFSFEKHGEEESFAFEVTVPAPLSEREFRIGAVATYGGRRYDEGYVAISARDVGSYDYYLPAVHVTRGVDVRIPADLRIGYVMGSGDRVPEALAFLGVEPELLDERDLREAALDVYDAVIIGVRAYAVRPDVRKYNGRLLSYAEQGGVLIVQYQTPEFDNNYGPYPYSMGRAEEVSEEDASVGILAPDNPVFARPNRITQADFSGWVEQRGSKFWSTWDERYVPLLESSDLGQPPQRGGMLYARYGKGAYLYSAYAWYRQLPAGVPGAFRIYANMLSLRRTLSER